MSKAIKNKNVRRVIFGKKVTVKRGPTVATVDESKIQQIAEARDGGATWETLERMFNLRRSNGMTAYRIVNKYKAMLADEALAKKATAAKS